MLSRHIEVPRKARYYLSAEPRTEVRELWVVLHGYGELAADFLARFAPAATDERLFVAPEALSRFYLRRGGGTIGASWMTRAERDNEIADYLGYLDLVLAQLRPHLDSAVRLGCLGFSQGVATACRWSLLGSAGVDALVLWAGGMPPDVDLEAVSDRLSSMRLTLVAGRDDPLLRDSTISELAGDVERHGAQLETIFFDGVHEVVPGPFPRIFGDD